MGDVSHIANVIKGQMPWLAHVSLSARALVIGSATKLIELAGGGPGVARVGDVCGRLIFDSTAGILYYSPSPTAAYVAVAPNPTSPIPPSPTAPGTSIVIATGSARVTCG